MFLAIFIRHLKFVKTFHVLSEVCNRHTDLLLIYFTKLVHATEKTKHEWLKKPSKKTTCTKFLQPSIKGVSCSLNHKISLRHCCRMSISTFTTVAGYTFFKEHFSIF